MERTITTIPATRNPYTEAPLQSLQQRRVAGYARVSTDDQEQLNSYENQVRYYTDYIQSRPEWKFVGMYTDEGISGTNTRHRSGFNKMVADALAGKIDLIITKSVSRFARNTVDSLTTIRKLKEKGVEVYFEKENIWTMDSKGELLITIMSSLAQEESRSISENTKWGRRKLFAKGQVSVPYRSFMGYDKGPNGKMVVNKEQAKVIKLIYQLFLSGMNYKSIANELTKRKIPTATGGAQWHASTICSILKNEKYKGDALLQKKFTVDFLTKKVKRNEGELPQYYVEGDHEAIISPEVFEKVQQEIALRKLNVRKYVGCTIFSAMIKCGECGSWYGPKTWHSTDKYRKTMLQCNGKTFHKIRCHTPALSPAFVKQLFIDSVNKLLKDKDATIQKAQELIKTDCDNTELKAQKAKAEQELQRLLERSNRVVELNSREALDQEKYRKTYQRMTERYEEAKKKYDETSRAIFQNDLRREQLEYLIEKLKTLKPQTEFDKHLWHEIVDYLTVYTKEDIRVRFKGGIEI